MNPPSSIAHYRITSKLGEGGMGAVYRATDTKLDRDVAIKVLPPEFAQDAERMVRFEREARVLASLNHSNIAAIFGVEEGALVMELVEGSPIAGPMPFDQAKPIIQQLIDALEYAHEKGIVHRDLKPANILITPDGRLKILDFGLAKAVGDDPPPGNSSTSPTLTMPATQAGMIMGTAGYMAPEQARGQKVDKRADIWAFGVVVYELLTGRTLFAADNISDSLAQVLTKIPDLSAVPERVRPLLERCLERDPRKRLRDIGDARHELERPPVVTAGAAQKRRPQMVWLAAALAFALGIAIFAWLWTRNHSLPSPLFRFTIDGGLSYSVSPNGRYLLTGDSVLQIRAVDQAGWRTLPGTENARATFWSPDSTTIGFVSGGQLRTTQVQGGNVRSLAPVQDPRGASWRGSAQSGQILYASAGRVHLFDLSTNKTRELALRVDGEGPLQPMFLPEGDSFLYMNGSTVYRSSLASTATAGEPLFEAGSSIRLARHPHTGEWHIFYLLASDGSDRTLVTAPIDPRTGAFRGQPAVVLDGIARLAGTRAHAFVAADNGIAMWRMTSQGLPIWRLTWYDRNGNIVGVVGEPAPLIHLALSPDETRAAVSKGSPIPRMWIYNLRTGLGEPLTTPAGSLGRAVWSPEGRSIYYTLRTGTVNRIIRQEVAGPPETIFENSEQTLPIIQDITPDGRHLILLTQSAQMLRSLELPASAASARLEPLLPHAGAARDVGSARMTPDGRWLTYLSGQIVYAVRYPPAGSNPIRIGNTGDTSELMYTSISRDGRTYFGYRLASQSVVAGNLQDSPEGLRLGPLSSLFHLTLPLRFQSQALAPSRDGNRFLAISTDATEELKIQVISDWTALLKERQSPQVP